MASILALFDFVNCLSTARRMAYEIIVNQTFGGRLEDREHALRVYRAHSDEVRSTIPAERLLVYDVKNGWEPLCEFLGVPVPDAPFPHVNTSAEFHHQRTVDPTGSNQA